MTPPQLRVFACSPEHQVTLNRRTREAYLVSCSCGWDPSAFAQSGRAVGWSAFPPGLTMAMLFRHLQGAGVEPRWLLWAQGYQTLYALGSRDFPTQPDTGAELGSDHPAP